MSHNHDKVTLNVEGMTCVNCAKGISNALAGMKLDGVNVDFATGEVAYDYNEAVEREAIIKKIEKLGYQVVDKAEQEEEHKEWLSAIEKRFIISAIFTVPLFFGHILVSMGVLSHDSIIVNPWVQLGLCIPVFILGMMYFGRSAFNSLKTGVPNMDVLITIGSLAAFAYSVAGLFLYQGHEVHNYLFFETAATIITLVLLGNVLEHRSVKQTTTALKNLMKMKEGTTKKVVKEHGHEHIIDIKIKSVKEGDVLQVNEGDKIPVDGKITKGSVSIDESMLTGESLAVDKSEDDNVVGGTILVNGNLRMVAERVGEETVLSQIIQMVRQAQHERPEIQKLGDKVSAVFVPIVLGISLLTMLLSFFVFDVSLQNSLMNSIAVLVISCPCAMGLATPTAMMVGIGRAAKNGILIKGGNTLEELAKVDKVVFDKTGTLTTGEFKISKITALNGLSEKEITDVLFNAEQHSSHPIANSIVHELKGKADNLEVEVKEEKGKGLYAKTKNGDEYAIGSNKIVEGEVRELHNLYILKNKELIGYVDLDDEIKPYAKETIELLNAQGRETILLSGDRKERCEELAFKLGIKTVYSEQSPEQKLEMIDDFSKQGKVAMVGDGINDAPALAKATVGISMGDATQVAIASAGVVLLSNEGLKQLHEAFLVSKHTLKTIKQNLFWAFFYNVVAIPIAAVGLLSPMIAALSMAFSDVIVIGNSIRLKVKNLK